MWWSIGLQLICVKRPFWKRQKNVFQYQLSLIKATCNYRLIMLMHVKNITECSKGSGAFCNTLTFIQLPFVIKIFILSIFEWPYYTGFTVCLSSYEDEVLTASCFDQSMPALWHLLPSSFIMSYQRFLPFNLYNLNQTLLECYPDIFLQMKLELIWFG